MIGSKNGLVTCWLQLRSPFLFIHLFQAVRARSYTTGKQHVMDTSEKTLDPFGRLCCWAVCAYVRKVALRDLMLRACSCGNSVHAACLEDLLHTFQAPSGFDKAVCSKGCYDKTRRPGEAAAPSTPKQTHPTQTHPTTAFKWTNDGPTPNVCSLSVLRDWITTGNNYQRYCSCRTQDEKVLIVQEIITAMASCGLKTTRSHADVMVAISLFQKSYISAQEWLKATQDEDMEPSAVRAGIIKRCLHFDALHPVMGKYRHELAPLPPQPARRVSMDDDGVKDGGTTSATIREKERPPKKQRVATPKAVAATVPSAKPVPKAPVLDTTAVSRAKTPLAVREAEARIQEALANASKLRQQEQFMGLQMAVMLLRERVKLRQEGVSQEDIDAFLPVYTSPQI